MTLPYTYILKFIPTNQFYYGVRYKENCNPDELFKTYFSSSKIIKRLIDDYGISSFEYEIRKVFNNKKSARDWEQKVLLKINAASDPKWLNQSNNMKGIIRGVGTYSWYYNPTTGEKLLLKNSSPVPLGFVKGERGPDKIQKGTIIITNILTGKGKRIKKGDPIPDGYHKIKLKGSTTNTLWICNDITGETKLLKDGEDLPVEWRFGNKHIKNKDKIKVYKNDPYVCKSISEDKLESYLANGWIKGNPGSAHFSIFKFENGEITGQDRITSTQLASLDLTGWIKGEPNLYQVNFYNGDIIIAPWQYLVTNYNISKHMIIYSRDRKTGGYSKKYGYSSIKKVNC